MPNPDQQNSKATVGVEVPEAVIDEAHRKGSMADPHLRPVNRAVIVAALDVALPHIEQAIRTEEREKVLGEVRKQIEKLPTFEPEHDESDRARTAFALGNDPIVMAEEGYPDTMGPAEWLRRSDVLAALNCTDQPAPKEDSYYLCFGCEKITHADKWTYLQLDEGEYRAVRDGDSDSHLKCPNCGEMHGDNYVGDGLEDGTLAECEAAKAKFLTDEAPKEDSGGDEGTVSRESAKLVMDDAYRTKVAYERVCGEKVEVEADRGSRLTKEQCREKLLTHDALTAGRLARADGDPASEKALTGYEARAVVEAALDAAFGEKPSFDQGEGER